MRATVGNSYYPSVVDKFWYKIERRGCKFELTRPEFIGTEIFLGCNLKLSAGSIQTGHTDLLPPYVFERSWQGCRLGVCKWHGYGGGWRNGSGGVGM